MGQRVRVKICGVRTVAELQHAAACGADAVGLNFHPPSPRFVGPAQARELLAALPPFVEAVGVFVNKRLDELRELLHDLGRLRTVQVHGGEPEVVDAAPYHHVPALQVRDEADLRRAEAYLAACRARGCLPAALLIDGHAPGLAGGTGQRAPWELVAGLRAEVPIILAGGLTPENVAEAVRVVRPYAVDVASGVESSPGVKCPDKVRAFIEAALSVTG
jgi:phosphoribosylanthranilate isomerase